MIATIATDRHPPQAPNPEANKEPSTGIPAKRLRLSPLRPTDLDAFARVFGDGHTARMTHAVPHPLTREAARDLLESMRSRPAHWAMRQGTGQMVGLISLSGSACGVSGGIHSFGPNLSVFVAPEHRGQGFAREAIDALMRSVGQKRQHRVIHAAHFADNAASARMLVGADFLYTGRRTFESSAAREGEHLALHMIRIM